MARLYQLFNFIPKGKIGLFKAQVVSKNGEVSDWTDWHDVTAGDTDAPEPFTASDITVTTSTDAIKVRIKATSISNAEVDVSKIRIYIREKTGTGALTFDSTWTPEFVINKDVYEVNYTIQYAYNTYYDIWVLPQDIIGNYETSPGAAISTDNQVKSAPADQSVHRWNFGSYFTNPNYNTIAWDPGTLTLSDGSTYSINSGTAASIAATTYIYFDKNASTSAFQTTTTAASAVGVDKLLVCVCKNNADTNKNAIFQTFGGTTDEGIKVFITADDIAANTVTANEIAANTITASEITAGTITGTEISSSTKITAGTGNNVGILDGADATYRIYAGHATAASAPFRVTQAGAMTSTSGEIGGFTVGSTTLTATNIKMDSANGLFRVGTPASTQYVDIYADGDVSKIMLYSSAGNEAVELYGTYSAGVDYGSYFHMHHQSTAGTLLHYEFVVIPALHKMTLNYSYSTDDMDAEINWNANALEISTSDSAEITLSPDGGVDINAADIAVDAAKKVMFEGLAGDTYIVYQNSRLEFFVNNTLEGYIDTNGFVST